MIGNFYIYIFFKTILKRVAAPFQASYEYFQKNKNTKNKKRALALPTGRLMSGPCNGVAAIDRFESVDNSRQLTRVTLQMPVQVLFLFEGLIAQ